MEMSALTHKRVLSTLDLPKKRDIFADYLTSPTAYTGHLPEAIKLGMLVSTSARKKKAWDVPFRREGAAPLTNSNNISFANFNSVPRKRQMSLPHGFLSIHFSSRHVALSANESMIRDSSIIICYYYHYFYFLPGASASCFL
ncbi:hypothetical protein I7I53_04964 [Histoplasma capsulatum var. duboisii H88]|uniref:Uncharacterized protein n=1 Tax=Ajellomyces capsulatus (strain H88) TaxID=544711 RepID=A0A8A1LVW7_AJEC8|nr:hypothetical protein I7I53_04964 [Histoplasma capsulatum var. duboisii H88]